MLQNGLLEEVKSVYPYKDLNALRTVGYSEFFDYLDGKTSFESAVELFKQHTRNYAKRQVTWFKAKKDWIII
jgi:tRNA dimethylallyltransferase